MDNLSCISIYENISVWDGGEEKSLPPWAISLIWLGEWCRRAQIHDKRLIVFVMLPTRELAASFIAFGSVLGGALTFVDSLSWPKFRSKPIGSVVYWKERQGNKKFEGTILKFEEMYGTELITLQVTKPLAAARRGDMTSIGRGKFDNYLFTEDEPPSSSRASTFSRSDSWFRMLLGNLSPKWIWSDGAECIVVTRMTGFENAITDLSLSCGDTSPVPMRELFCFAKSNESKLAKVRIAHPRGKLDGIFPIAILDGPDAFHEAPHLLGATNILTVLDRSEFSEGIKDRLLELGAVASDVPLNELGEFPAHFPPGFELAAYIVNRE